MVTSVGPRILRALLRLVTAFALIAWPAALAQAAARPTVTVLSIDGPINPVVAGYVERGLREAERDHASAVVLRLDTPGGLDSAMRDIIKAMLVSPVPVVVYVSPQGGRAASAGMFITVAAHVAAMAPDTAIGAAHPVGGAGEEIKGPMADKVTNDAVAYVRGLAAQRGRNVAWVEAAVRKSVSLPADEAVRQHVVELTAPSTEALLDRLDGRKVMVMGLPQVLHTRGAALHDYPMAAPERFLHAIANPALALILLNLGVLGIIFELQNPSGFVPGVIGVILLLLGLFALGMLPINWVGVALIFFGLLLLITELFLPSFGVLGVGGIISLVLGTMILFQSNVPGITPSLPLLMTIALSSGALLAFAMSMGLRAQRRRVATGREELIGREAVARSALAPAGMVFLEGELWSAESDGQAPIDAGDRVTIERVEGLRLVVRKKLQNG
jgi:membrane-bound serine protease (ClpP class)